MRIQSNKARETRWERRVVRWIQRLLDVRLPMSAANGLRTR
jgi:hypothetical protein